MFSINYLYSIKDNFAILYRGSDKKIVEQIILESKNLPDNIKIAIFVKPDFIEEGLFSLDQWHKMENSFTKYYEVLVDPKNPNSFKM